MNLSHLIIFIGLALNGMVLSTPLEAKQANIICHTARHTYALTLNGTGLKLHEVGRLAALKELKSNRQLASTAKTTGPLREGVSLEQKLTLERSLYTVRIGNVGSFREIDDSLEIRNQKGHSVTYPLTCGYQK